MSETDKTICVLLADDHPALRAGIRTILERAPDIQAVGEAEGGTEARRLTTSLRPQVLVLDLRMPGPRQAETVAWVRAHCPETAVLVADIAYAGGPSSDPSLRVGQPVWRFAGYTEDGATFEMLVQAVRDEYLQ
jgi:chemotaxis response regulator CheB